MYIIFLDPDMHEVQLKFFFLRNAMSQNSESLMETFLKTFQSKGVSDVSGKKIYFASDSDTVNSDLKNELITKIHKKSGDHISFVWCLAHQLELAIKDAFEGSDMTEIECVLDLLYMYKNSSKKWRVIQELFQSIKDDFDFEDSDLRPTKTYGTRWISHCLNALHKFYKKFKVFVLHLKNQGSNYERKKYPQRSFPKSSLILSNRKCHPFLIYIGTCERSQHCITK